MLEEIKFEEKFYVNLELNQKAVFYVKLFDGQIFMFEYSDEITGADILNLMCK